MRMSREEELRKQIEPLQNELREIREIRDRQLNDQFVGKYFKYHNSYGSGEKWWLYAYVKENGEEGLKALVFEKRSMNDIHIQTDHWFVKHDGYTEITAKEFSKAWKALTDDILELAIPEATNAQTN